MRPNDSPIDAGKLERARLALRAELLEVSPCEGLGYMDRRLRSRDLLDVALFDVALEGEWIPVDQVARMFRSIAPAFGLTDGPIFARFDALLDWLLATTFSSSEDR